MSHLLLVCSGQPRNVPKRVIHTCKVVVLVIRFDPMIFFYTVWVSRCRCCRGFCKLLTLTLLYTALLVNFPETPEILAIEFFDWLTKNKRYLIRKIFVANIPWRQKYEVHATLTAKTLSYGEKEVSEQNELAPSCSGKLIVVSFLSQCFQLWGFLN